MSDLVWTLHTVSGAVARVPQHLVDHEHFGKYLVEVDPNAKPYEPTLWKPSTADEYRATHNIESVEIQDDDQDDIDTDTENEE
jgi:hypothetical protein